MDYYLDDNHDAPDKSLDDFLKAKAKNKLILLEGDLSLTDYVNDVLNHKTVLRDYYNNIFLRKTFIKVINYALRNNNNVIIIGLTDEQMISEIKKHDYNDSVIIIGKAHKGVINNITNY